MLYLPEKAYQLDGGVGYFLFYRDEYNVVNSVEAYTDEYSPPPHIVKYQSDKEIEEVEQNLISEDAIKVNAHDYRINIDEQGRVEIRGRIKNPY